MHIKKYSCNRFAGLKDKSIEFENGMNVILGPNESGKSTIIEGIHGTLFKNVKLTKRDKEDINFRNRFMPQPKGDSIDGEIVIDIDGEEYKLMKEWGASQALQLITPDGDLIKSEDKVDEILCEILQFGEGTYSSIVFAKQRELKEAIDRILENREATNEISSVLRQTIMELDGVSIEKLKANIDNEIDELLKKWDIDKNYPEGNRGFDNQWKKGHGHVVKCFYNMECLKDEMESANTAELEFENICNELNDNKKTMEQLKLKKEEMEKIEGDVSKRAILETEIKMLEKDMKDIGEINGLWPQKKLLLSQINSQIKELSEKKIALNVKKENAKKSEEKQKLIRTITKIDELKVETEKINEEINATGNISEEDIKKLEKLNLEIIKIEAIINSNEMIGRLNKIDPNRELWITKDFGESVKVNLEEVFKANKFIKIQYDDVFELELQIGDTDIADLTKKYNYCKDEFQGLLNKLNVASLEEAKLKKAEIAKLNNEKSSLENQINILLGEEKYGELKQRLIALKDITSTRSIEDIEKELNQIGDSEIELKGNKNSLESTLKDWEVKYTDQDYLLDILVEYRAEKKLKEKEMVNLAPLPEGYESSDEFKKELNAVRNKYEEIQEEYDALRSEYYQCQNNLPDTSYEELNKDYKDALAEFEKTLNRSKKMLKIKEVFDNTQEKMDANTFTPLVSDLTLYLSMLTDGNYTVENIDEDFNVRLENSSNVEMPIELLSSGTYDCVALALRFSLLKYIFKDSSGYVILDDCLVDLDPDRKNISAKLIKEFAKTNQVIFTTCDPETAKLLGGNILELR